MDISRSAQALVSSWLFLLNRQLFLLDHYELRGTILSV